VTERARFISRELADFPNIHLQCGDPPFVVGKFSLSPQQKCQTKLERTKQTMKEKILIVCVLALSACAGTGTAVEFYPVAHKQTAGIANINPKSVTWYNGPAPTDKPEVTVIGTSRIFVSNRLNRDRVINQLRKVAADHGANAVFTQLANVNASFVPYNIPPVTMDMPQTSYVNTSSTIYNPYSGPYGFPSQGTVSTTGTITTNVPREIVPGRSGIARVETGELVAQFAVIRAPR
jgi:hypothetical protein